MSKTEGADFMMGSVGLKPKREAKIHNSGELDIDAAVQFLDSKKDGEALRAGLDKAVSAIEAIKKTGLTGECLVVLVTSKCENAANGKPISDDTVRRVLQALFRLNEFVR